MQLVLYPEACLMDEESATTVALPFLLRGGRWHNTAIVLHYACMHGWMCGKVHGVEKQLKLFCAFPLALCVCCGDFEY